MIKRGVVILKPDFFEYNIELSTYLKELINKNNLHLESFFEIKRYGDFCERYRKYDIENSMYTKEETNNELIRTSYAIYVYKNKFFDKSAIALIFFDEDADKLYDKLSMLKSKIREYIKQNKLKEYYVDIQTPNWKVIERTKNTQISAEYFEMENVKLAYLNGIHLEEKSLFDKNICYNFLKKENIIQIRRESNEKLEL